MSFALAAAGGTDTGGTDTCPPSGLPWVMSTNGEVSVLL